MIPLSIQVQRCFSARPTEACACVHCRLPARPHNTSNLHYTLIEISRAVASSGNCWCHFVETMRGEWVSDAVEEVDLGCLFHHDLFSRYSSASGVAGRRWPTWRSQVGMDDSLFRFRQEKKPQIQSNLNHWVDTFHFPHLKTCTYPC
jgi:hypothetical protein